MTGIPVGRTADALFFLHSFRQSKAWQAPARGDRTPPTVWQYVVRYADGQSAIVPVRLNEGVAGWLQQNPLGLADAVVAWSCQFSGDKRQATVYQMQWNNPRPAVPIAAIDIAYDATAKNGFGVPIVLAITAASAAK